LTASGRVPNTHITRFFMSEILPQTGEIAQFLDGYIKAESSTGNHLQEAASAKVFKLLDHLLAIC
jgi:hypothetical protein